MIMYRPHCGGIAEAWERRKEFDTIKQMIDYVVSEYNAMGFEQITADNISFKLYYGKPDERIGWNITYLISINGNAYAWFTDDYKNE